MGDGRTITGRRIVGIGVFVMLIGTVLVYGPMLYNFIQTGEVPKPVSLAVGIGNILMIVGPWIIRGRSAVRRAVN
jgi:hypothetical protein